MGGAPQQSDGRSGETGHPLYTRQSLREPKLCHFFVSAFVFYGVEGSFEVCCKIVQTAVLMNSLEIDFTLK